MRIHVAGLLRTVWLVSLLTLSVNSFSQSSLSGKITVSGSDTLAVIVETWAQEFSVMHPQVQFQLQAAGSSSATTALVEGTSILGTMSRKMTDSERARFREQYGYEPFEIPIAIDALAIFVNKHNPLTGITLQQIDSVFSITRYCGEQTNISHWDQLVGAPEFRHREIKLYGRHAVSGTYGFVRETVLCHGDFKANLNQMLGSSAVVKAISEDKFGIGYSAIGFQGANTRPLRVQNEQGQYVDASVINAVSGRYPLARHMYLYVNMPIDTPLDSLHRGFLAFILSERGQSVVSDEGFVPLSAKTRALYQKRLLKQ